MNELAIYIHWPYCARICPYCDFNVYKQRADNELRGRIIEDLKSWREWTGERKISSIHFGGGTPSLMSAEDIKNILAAINSNWPDIKDVEIAIEANPHDADKIKWRAYAQAGVNRLSLGVQSFHDPALKLLGRDHSTAKAKEALSLAVDIFPSVSLDLIFGWAEQTQALLQQDLDIALQSGAQHISAYQLTIEEGTAFAKAQARGDIKAVDPDKSADFYDLIRARLCAEGFEHYEVSNFARESHHSRHNLTYWMGGDYVGVGPGAHGRLTHEGKRYATVAAMRPDAYKTEFLEEKTELTPTAWAEEYLLMGLRIETGISLSRFKEIGGSELDETALIDFKNAGFIQIAEDRIAATTKGRLVLNMITEKLLVR